MTIEYTLCPLCDTKMIRATSKYGPYWRCPRWGCKGTRDAEGRSKQEKDDEYEKEKE